MWLAHSFIIFPATQVTIEFSNRPSARVSFLVLNPTSGATASHENLRGTGPDAPCIFPVPPRKVFERTNLNSIQRKTRRPLQKIRDPI